MEYRNGATVYTSNGEEAGNLDRVVLEPESNEVTHIVVKKGLLFKDDKVIPVVHVATTSTEKVILNCSTEDLEEMSPLKIKEPDVMGDASRGQNFDPLSGAMIGSPAATRTVTRRTIPEDLVALKEGAHVLSEEGQHIGNLESIFTEPDSDLVTNIVVSHGLLAKTRKSIPIWWVKSFDEDRVQLTIAAREYDGLLSDQDWPAS